MRVEVLVDRSEFGELLGEKLVNGRKLVVEEVIGELTVELRPAIDAAVSRRRKMLEDRRPVAEKWRFPRWEERHGMRTGTRLPSRRSSQGLLDNLHNRETPLRWRLNDKVPVLRGSIRSRTQASS
jgi:hypothetical protein